MSKCPSCGFIFQTRSNPQNALYWSKYIEPMANEAGCTPEEIHEALKSELLSKQVMIKTKQGIALMKTSGTTTELKTKEFSDYLERVAEIAARVYGIVIE